MTEGKVCDKIMYISKLSKGVKIMNELISFAKETLLSSLDLTVNKTSFITEQHSVTDVSDNGDSVTFRYTNDN